MTTRLSFLFYVIKINKGTNYKYVYQGGSSLETEISMVADAVDDLKHSSNVGISSERQDSFEIRVCTYIYTS